MSCRIGTGGHVVVAGIMSGQDARAVHDVLETVAFGRFRLDCRRRALLVDGAPVTLHARAFDVLEFLVASRERVVSRDEIVTHVWRGMAIGQNNLTVQMSALRRALAEHGGGGLIITLAGRGYRFVGDVNVAPEAAVVLPDGAPDGAPDEAPGVAPDGAAVPDFAETGPVTPAAVRAATRRRWRVVAPFAAAVVVLLAGAWLGWRAWQAGPQAPRLSLAVLPFRNFSDDRSQDYLADAVTDDLTTDLSHMPGSVVIARESAEQFGSRSATPLDIGRALHVRYLVRGSLRAEDGTFHVNARLVDTATGDQVWSERFDPPAAQLGEARNDIVRRIASALDVQLTDMEGARSLHERPDNPDAVDLFFRARSIVEHDDSLAGFSQAQGYLEQATRLQPDFADAWAELALTLVMKLVSTDDPTDYQDRVTARHALDRAEHLVPQNATALAADARLLQIDGNCAAASAKARQALVSEPNSLDALAVLAKCAMSAGQLVQSIAYNEQVLRLNPESPKNKARYLSLAQASLLLGRYDEAIDRVDRALAGDGETLPAPGASSMDRVEWGRLLLIAATDLGGDTARARALYAAYARIYPHRTVWRVGAYVDRGLVDLLGYRRFMDALADAGMRRAADEHADDGVPTSTTPRGGGDFEPVPTAVPGAGTVDTHALVVLLRAQPNPIVIDLGRGAAAVPGASWNDPSADLDDPAFVDRTLAARCGGNRNAPVVIMSTGTYGASSYNGVLHAVASGYRQVYWYRGGEEAWQAAGQPALDLRPQ